MNGDRPRRFPSDEEMRTLLAFALPHIPLMERNVLRRRLGLHAPGDPWSLTKTASDLGITIERTRQIEFQARRRVRNMRDRGLLPPVVLPPTTPTTTEEGAHDPGEEPRTE
jgi:DNA-directed RNA polymerase sigma subunit (sigma70/sigma32)